MRLPFTLEFWPTVFLVLALPTLIGLGTWQVIRLQWKSDLLATIDDRFYREPVPLPADMGDGADWHYARVTVTGRYDPAHDFRQAGQLYKGQLGNQLHTVFHRSEGVPIIIRRGWVPDYYLDQVPVPSGTVTVTGVARLPPERGAFQPDNDPERRLFYWVDLAAMATAADVDVLAPVVLFALPGSPGTGVEGGFPFAAPPIVNIPNRHLEYALTWYALAVTLVVIFVMYHRRRREGTGDDPTD